MIWAALLGCGDRPPPCATLSPSRGARGNVVFVLLDDIGVDKVAAYGVHDEPAFTPNLDALAARGLRFTSAYSQPVCSPARAALLTGRRAVRTGIGRNIGGTHGLPLDEITIPEALAALDAGYSSMAVGKWHLTATRAEGAATAPLDQGFDRFDGLIGNPPQLILPEDEDEVEDADLPDGNFFDWQRDVDGVLTNSTDYLLTAQADAAIAALDTLPEPFFLYVALSGAHHPLHVPPADLWGHADLQDEAGIGDAVIEATDHELGRLLDAIGDRATVFVVSDNGTSGDMVRPPADEHHAKGSLYPGGIHVPLLAAGPGVGPGVSDELVYIADLFPTALDLAGVDAAALGVPLDAQSLVPLLDGDGLGRRCVIIDRFSPNLSPRPDAEAVTVLEDGFQLVRYDRGPDELYAVDPLAPVEGDDLLAERPLRPRAETALRALRSRLRHDE